MTDKFTHEHATPSQQNPSLPEHVEARLAEIWQQAYTAQSNEDLKKLYANWADSYDEDHDAVGFFGHHTASELLAQFIEDPGGSRILDAGAGTGAAGIALAQRGFRHIVGVDLSEDMLRKAAEKKVYKQLHPADLSIPLDTFAAHEFDAAILVGVFSYGQAPAHALEEVIRVVRPGGVIVFTMRTDFFESDEMSVQSKMAEMEENQLWELLEVTDPEPYLPNKDPDAFFRVWAYRVLEEKIQPVDDEFAGAVTEAWTSDEPVKRLDHRYIWNSSASRLYNRYIETPEYYLNDCEEEILRTNADEIVNGEEVVVELGCGSATKVKHLLGAADVSEEAPDNLTYVPIDLSPAALESTKEEIEETFEDRIEVDPVHAPFAEALEDLDSHKNKLILFFGSSIGNLETLEETVDFLRMVREGMHEGDRFLVGMDLHKEEEVLRDAYEAGEANRLFFLNIIRRMNDELGGSFDLDAFYQESPYERDDPYKGIETRCVNFKLVTRETQEVHLERIGLDVQLEPGESVQVGISRKFRREDIQQLASHAGLKLKRQWLDRRGWFSLNEMVPATSRSNPGQS